VRLTLIGRNESRSVSPLSDWRRGFSGEEQVSLRPAESTVGWADRSGDSDARRLPTKVWKSGQLTRDVI
ncbi:hypothetical protein INR49_020183, partial [Caranx melampygus]